MVFGGTFSAHVDDLEHHRRTALAWSSTNAPRPADREKSRSVQLTLDVLGNGSPMKSRSYGHLVVDIYRSCGVFKTAKWSILVKRDAHAYKPKVGKTTRATQHVARGYRGRRVRSTHDRHGARAPWIVSSQSLACAVSAEQGVKPVWAVRI
jgi:hypothetical protein